MKETISNNKKSLVILNKLVQNGFYEGNIYPNKFELARKKSIFSFTGNYRIIGILNNENQFELNFDFTFPLNIGVKIAFVFGIIFSIIALTTGYWFLPILFFVIPFLILFINFKIKKKQEINFMTSKFLELYKLEYGLY